MRQVVRHLQRHGADVVAVLLQITARDLQRLGDRLADRIVEPGLDAEMEEGDGEARHQYRGRHRHTAEQQHQAYVQPRASGAAAAFHPDAGQPPGQHGDQQQHRREIGQHEAHADTGPQHERRATRQENEGRQPDRECQRRQHQRHRLAEQDVGDPAEHRASPRYLRRQRRLDGRFGFQRRRWRRDIHISPRTTGISRSRIFLRSVLRLRPSMAAALIWLPRVAARVSRISGRSTSAITRS